MRYLAKRVERICDELYRLRIDFETTVDWKEHQHLLKAHFPMDVHTDEATFEIQFGNVTRKTHLNTSWDQARFESCGQKWIDVSEGHYGISLLNDCKYGHSVHNGEMALTLIKSGTEPNPVADQEMHVFTNMAQRGDRSAGVLPESACARHHRRHSRRSVLSRECGRKKRHFGNRQAGGRRRRRDRASVRM